MSPRHGAAEGDANAGADAATDPDSDPDPAIGDALVLDGPAAAHTLTGGVVVAVAREAGAGMSNPQTPHGDILMDGICCSTVIAAVPGGVVVAEPGEVLLLAKRGSSGGRRRRGTDTWGRASGVAAPDHSRSHSTCGRTR